MLAVGHLAAKRTILIHENVRNFENWNCDVTRVDRDAYAALFSSVVNIILKLENVGLVTNGINHNTQSATGALNYFVPRLFGVFNRAAPLVFVDARIIVQLVRAVGRVNADE